MLTSIIPGRKIVPEQLFSQGWTLSLALYLNDLSPSDVERVSGFEVEHVTERMRAAGDEPEGVLSDIRF